eukprot:403357516
MQAQIQSNNNTLITYTVVNYEKRFSGEHTDNYVPNIVQFLGVDYFLDQMPFKEYMEIQYIVCHILVAVLALFLMMIFTRELGTINLSSQRKLVTKVFIFIIVTLARTLQVPLLTFMFKVYSCDDDAQSIEDNFYYNGSFCYKGDHMQLVIYSTIILIFYYALVMYFQYFLTLSYPHEKIPWACLPTKIPLLIEVLKFAIVFTVDFALYEKDFDALIMMFTLHELIERSSYDDKQDFILRGLELAQMSPFSKNYDSSTMNQNTNNHTTTHSYSQREQSDGDELSTLKVFYGSKKSQKKQNKSKGKFLKKFLIDNINVFLDAFPNSVKLHIMAAFIYFSIFKNSFKSLYELSFTKSIKSSLQDDYECFVLSSQIIAYFQSRASQGMSNQPVQFEKSKDDKKSKKGMEFNASNFEVETEIKSVIEFEKINIKFQKMIELASNQTREFWEEILKKNIDVKKIFDLGAKIYKSFIDIKKKYKNLMQLNNNYLEVAYLYKLFVSLILNFEIEVEDAKLEIVKIMQSKSMKKHNLKAEYKSIQLLDENGMIIISGNTNNFAKILAMNNKAERIFGYQTNDLIHQKLKRLMPTLFMDNHEAFILNFVNGNRKINKENHNFVWGKHKSGFIVPLIMDINAYVNFEFNFCFIAFLKRSVLLEFKPMRELLEYQDVFVVQTNSGGIIQDMTQNMSEYLNFPVQALQKDIQAEGLFKNIFDDEVETSFMNGRKMEFDPQVLKKILEEEDIDVKDVDSDNGTNYNMSEKKCTAIVWLKTFEYDYQDVKLAYKEIWFVLTDDDASFLDTKNTTEYMTALGDDGPKVNVTYTDDREEICSIASVSSLANYDKNRKNILNKLSEIKTQTIDDQKPRQIDLLQKATISVFVAVISIALLLLVVIIDRNSGFFTNVDIIKKSKESVIYYSQLRTMMSTIVLFDNSRYSYKSDPLLSTLNSYIIDYASTEIENLRISQSYMNFIEFEYSSQTLEYKKSTLDNFLQIRSSNLIQKKTISKMQGIQELLDICHDLTPQVLNYTFDTKLLNYDDTNSNTYKGPALTDVAENLYQFLKNSHKSLSNYLFVMSEKYIEDAIYQANNNQSLVLILTIVSITITFLTAFIIIPILHKIERSKEKVLMIYTELKKEQIESLNRNIKVFFMKLTQSTSSLGGSLLYQNSSKQFSGKLVTRKFTTMTSKKVDENNNDFGFLLRRAAPIGEPENEEGVGLDDDLGGQQNQKNVKSHFPLLFNKSEEGKKQSQTDRSGDKSNKGKKKGKLLKIGKRNKNQVPIQQSKNGNQRDFQEEESEYDKSEDEHIHNRNRSQDDGEDDSDLSDNAEEDKKAKMLMSKEEEENALFKRLFQNKIKQMTCLKQAKYYLLVLGICLFMSGYFTLSYFMVSNIFNDSQNSLNIFATVGNRGPFLDSLISYYLQTITRGQEIYVQPYNQSDTNVNSLDYFYAETQKNENDYNMLRRRMPSILLDSRDLIIGLESQQMCEWLITQSMARAGSERIRLLDECKNISNRMLQLGLTQTVNTMLQNILQGTLQFRNGFQLKQDKEQQLFTIIYVRFKYLNHVDLDLLSSVESSIKAYFTIQQKNYIILFSVFVSVIVISMILLSYNGVDYLFKNLIAIKFILNFIPGQWLLDNNAADDLKYIDF